MKKPRSSLFASYAKHTPTVTVQATPVCRTLRSCLKSATATDTYSPDAVPPIHAVSYLVATDKVPAQNGDKFRSIFSDGQSTTDRNSRKESTWNAIGR